MNRKNITMIDDLPFLDDLNTNQILPPSDINFSKYIRNTAFNPPSEAGMLNKPQQPPPFQQTKIQQPPQQQLEPTFREIQYEADMDNSSMIPISCVHVAHHASNCIVCSKLYTNDKTNYVIVIILLLTICVILFKKILDQK